ncbi:threonylcarbamoyl-AMP synthase [bacterium]|nr:threonylcarbamoyl-AMP synthase [bacterium]
MKVIHVDAKNPDIAVIKEAADAIRRGELVIFPTETVYGLAADALNEDAVRKVFQAKGRSESHPLPVQVAGVEQLSMVASDVSQKAICLAKKYWPGPLTIVIKKNESVSDLVSGGLDSVGVRVPDHPVALALLRELDSPIVATSANLTGKEPPKTAEQAVNQIGDKVSIVLDAGECEIGVASTVVDISVDPPKILRIGTIDREQIEQVIMEKNIHRAAERKVESRSELKKIVGQAKSEGKKVVFTNGCFDILHIGHVRYLQDARALGDILVVGVNSDRSVRRLKGEGRPVVAQSERAEVLAALECVDYVTIFDEDTPIELIMAIMPDIHVKGGDYRPEDLPEAEVMRKIGGVVHVIPYSDTDSHGHSTTNLIEKVTGNR